MKLKSLLSSHKVIGMIATFFVIMLSLTGILLMHTQDLELEDAYIENRSLLAIYDIEPENDPVTYFSNGSYFTQIDNHLYMNDVELDLISNNLIGVVNLEDFFIVGLQTSLILVTAQGELVETLEQTHGVPEGITSIGIHNDNIVINANGVLLSSDLELVKWQSQSPVELNWSEKANLPNHMLDTVMRLYLGEGLPLERVIQDIHSGRIFGTVGVVIVDLAVILFLALSITGWLAWFKKRELQKLIDAEDE
jgi:hypothetical protein